VVIGFDIRLTEKNEPAGTILFNGREWDVYDDELPLYMNDFAETGNRKSSCRVREEKSSILVEYGEYSLLATDVIAYLGGTFLEIQ